MSHRVVIFEDLVKQVPSILTTLEELGAETILVSQGKDVLPKARECSPAVVILDVFMPQMSGIELCRLLKESAIGAAPKVVLVSAEESQRIAQRSLDYGCDLYVKTSEAGAKVPPFLVEHLKTNQPEEKREDEGPQLRRIDLSGTLRYLVAEAEYTGELINASGSGILFAALELIPNGTLVDIVFEGTEGTSFMLATTIARSITLKDPVKDMQYGIGAKFVSLSPDDKQKLDALLSFRERKPPKMEPPTLHKILRIKPNELPSFLQAENDPLRMKTYVGELAKHEQDAFQAEGKVAECLRKLVLYRAKCGAFGEFLPTLRADLKNLGPIFFPYLRDLLAEVDLSETEIDQVVKEAVAEGNETSRRELNETSNRLHASKSSLLFAADRALTVEHVLAGDRVILEAIKKRATELHALDRPTEANLKYDRRAPIPLPPKEVVVKKKSIFASRGVQIGIISVSSLALGFLLWFQFGGRVKTDDLKVPSLSIESATVQDEGLKVYTTDLGWVRLSEVERNEALDKLAEYLQAKRLHQAVLYNEKNVRLAAISSASAGRKRIYTSRIFATAKK